MTGMLQIGSLQLDFPVIQAALSGYSDLAMRRTSRLHGAMATLGPVVLDQFVLIRGKKHDQSVHMAPDDHPIGGQLIGATPESMALAADGLVKAGFDWIDINLACPVRKVLGRHRGGFLLSQPSVALEIVRSVRNAIGGRRPLTVKLRRGTDDSAESQRNFFEVLDGALALGVDAITLHPRTVRQRYVGPSDWSFLKRIRQHVGNRTLLGSGDLFTAQDVIRMMESTGVDGVSMARGAIGNPWIYRECRALLAGQPLPPAPTVAEQGRTIRQHLAWCIERHGFYRGCRIMRKFCIKYSEFHPHGTEVRDTFIRAKTEDDWNNLLMRWYDPNRPWPEAKRPVGPGDLVAAGAVTDQDEA